MQKWTWIFTWADTNALNWCVEWGTKNSIFWRKFKRSLIGKTQKACLTRVRLGLDCDEKEKNACLRFFCGSHALFTRPTSTDFSKFFFKIGSHGTIHTFKNYFATVFSVFKQILIIRYSWNLVMWFYLLSHS